VLKREKAGSKVDAIKLLKRRKDDLLQGIVKTEAARQPAIRFGTLCDDILVFTAVSRSVYPQQQKQIPCCAAE
jgi:hypothetical protein